MPPPTSRTSNMAGFFNSPVAPITASAPVASKHSMASFSEYTPPLATTGIDSVSLIRRMTAHCGVPECARCSLSLACTVSIVTPALSSISANSSVCSSLGNIRILADTGTRTAAHAALIMASTSTGLSIWYAPQPPTCAVFCGHLHAR